MILRDVVNCDITDKEGMQLGLRSPPVPRYVHSADRGRILDRFTFDSLIDGIDSLRVPRCLDRLKGYCNASTEPTNHHLTASLLS